MSHLLQWRELAYLCKQGVSYPFSGSDYDKSSRPTTIKIGRVTRLFLNGITDVFSFSPHLRRTSGIIHPHMFIINATKHHPVPSRTGTQTTNCTRISHIHKHKYRKLKNWLLIIFLFRGIRRKSRDALTRIALWLLR